LVASIGKRVAFVKRGAVKEGKSKARKRSHEVMERRTSMTRMPQKKKRKNHFMRSGEELSQKKLILGGKGKEKQTGKTGAEEGKDTSAARL